MIAASGAALAAPALLAACGETEADDDRSEANDPDLLNPVLAQHLAVASLTEFAKDGALPDVATELAAQRKESIAQLEKFISDRDGEAESRPAQTAEAESATEALSLQLEESIATALESIGDLSSPTYRQAVHRFITEDAAALAALRDTLGGEVAPDAYVFGAASEGEDSQ